MELRAGLSLAGLFGLRMMGLFLILPVFAVHAVHLRGGGSQTLVGIALGAYGLTQGLLQIPFGMASDRYGRKRIIVIGLILFALGSFVAAFATDIWMTIFGRCIQGAGAISAAVMALAADLTRDQHRTKVMAMIGASIGAVFALSLVLSPALYQVIGMSGIFGMTGLMALFGIFVVTRIVPPEPVVKEGHEPRGGLRGLQAVLRNRQLLRLNVGIFVLHMVQMAMFVVVPVAMVRHGGLPVEAHWKVYLPVVLASFVLMLPPLLLAERHGRTRSMFFGAVILMLMVQAGLALWVQHLSAVIALLVAFFVAFNLLEATLPSLVTRIAPASSRGAAIGVYNTTQALGLFAGGAAGGWLAQNQGDVSVFVFGMVLVALWLIIASGMRVPGQQQKQTLAPGSGQN